MESRQSGGIVTFAIVAVILAGLLAGGLYLSKQQGRVATNGSGGTTDTTQVTPPVSDPVANPETDEQNNGAPSTPQQSQPTRNPQSPQTSSTSTNQPVASTGPSEVPSTGPTETLAVTLAFGVLAFAGYRLVSSHRDLRRSALGS